MAQKKRSTRKPPAGEAVSDHERACPVGFCPVGMFLTVTGSARPEAVEHLVAAGREFMLALASLLNARIEDLERRPSLEKIEVE